MNVEVVKKSGGGDSQSIYIYFSKSKRAYEEC